jgi:hypothetical protein
MGFRIAPITGIATILKIWKKSYKIFFPSPFIKKSVFGFKSLEVNGLKMGIGIPSIIIPKPSSEGDATTSFLFAMMTEHGLMIQKC